MTEVCCGKTEVCCGKTEVCCGKTEVCCTGYRDIADRMGVPVPTVYHDLLIQRGGRYGGPGCKRVKAPVPNRCPRQSRCRHDSDRSALRSRNCERTTRR
jgi:hypothetical protein